MDALLTRLGFWSSIFISILVLLIDIGMIASTISLPLTSIANMETYAASFSSIQMLPFVPSFVLAPFFVLMMLCIHFWAPQDRKILSQLGFSFSLISAAILSIHYYIQLTVVQQGILNNEISGLWQFAAPNPHSFFWAFAALGYGFMGIALLCVVPIFSERSSRSIKWLFLVNGLIGILFLVGNILGLFLVNILASFAWGVLFPVASLLLAKRYKVQKQN